MFYAKISNGKIIILGRICILLQHYSKSGWVWYMKCLFHYTQDAKKLYLIIFYATDCDNLTNIGPHLINEMTKYNNIDLNSNLPDYCIKDIIKCYLYQSEYVCTSSKNSWNKLIYIYIKRLLTLKIGQNVLYFFKKLFISSLPCL